MGLFQTIKSFFLSSTTQDQSKIKELYNIPKNENRAFQVYDTSEIVRIAAKDKYGLNLSYNVQIPFSQVDPLSALNIFNKCAPIFGLISGRANKVSATEWHITPKGKHLDKYVSELRNTYELYKEYENSPNHGLKVQLLTTLYQEIPELKPDLGNFEKALYRKSKRIKETQSNKCNEIEDWLSSPSPGVSFPDFLKMIVQDLLIHGATSIYKNPQKHLYVLPGGSVDPVRNPQVGGIEAYFQLIDNKYEIFYPSEIAYAQYMPNSSTAYGIKPMDSIINLVTEYLFFESESRDKADGFEPPNKLIVFGDKSTGFEDMTESLDPLNPDEQRRIEFKLNRPSRDGAIATLTGYGQPLLVDLSKADIYASQMQRQDQILKFLALVYNASNLEINETGASGTSGRSTSEAQERSDNSKGVRPLYQIIEGLFNQEILPYFFGRNYVLEFSESLSIQEQIEVAKLKKESGLMTPNEIRVSDLSLDPHPDPMMDLPSGITPEQENAQLMGQIQESIKSKNA